MDARKSTIFAFQLVKPISQTITHLIQQTVLGIQFWSVKYTTATVRYARISSISSSGLLNGKRLQWPDYMKTNHFKKYLALNILIQIV